jgi:tripartite-type tricarboxylate transporter receptor subunit TctC
VNYMFDSITSAKPHIASGKLRPLAVTTARRSPTLPNVPTLAEAGLPGYQVSPWFAVFVPALTPKIAIEKLHAALSDAMKQPEIKAKFDSIGAEPIGSSPSALGAHLNEELVRWGQVIAERGIKAD